MYICLLIYFVVPQGAPENIRIQNLDVEAKNSSSVTIIWDPIPKYLSGGVINGYIISYAAVVDKNNIESVHVDGPNVSYVLPYLKCYTGYLLRVRAYTSLGKGPETERITFKTAEGSESFFYYY